MKTIQHRSSAMKTLKSVMLGATALLLIGWTIPASAHHMDRNDGRGGYYNNSGDRNDRDYARQQVKICREHQRLHQAINQEHQDSHDQGASDSQDHADTHADLNAAHEQYHAGHPRAAHNCDYWLSRSRNRGRGY